MSETKDPWLCHICKRRHANACPMLWGGSFVPAPDLPVEDNEEETSNE